MKRKHAVTAIIIALSVASITGCGDTEDIKETMAKMDTVEIDRDKEDTQDKKDDTSKTEDKKTEDKKDESKTEDKETVK